MLHSEVNLLRADVLGCACKVITKFKSRALFYCCLSLILLELRAYGVRLYAWTCVLSTTSRLRLRTPTKAALALERWRVVLRDCLDYRFFRHHFFKTRSLLIHQLLPLILQNRELYYFHEYAKPLVSHAYLVSPVIASQKKARRH